MVKIPVTLPALIVALVGQVVSLGSDVDPLICVRVTVSRLVPVSTVSFSPTNIPHTELTFFVCAVELREIDWVKHGTLPFRVQVADADARPIRPAWPTSC